MMLINKRIMLASNIEDPATIFKVVESNEKVDPHHSHVFFLFHKNPDISTSMMMTTTTTTKEPNQSDSSWKRRLPPPSTTTHFDNNNINNNNNYHHHRSFEIDNNLMLEQQQFYGIPSLWHPSLVGINKGSSCFSTWKQNISSSLERSFSSSTTRIKSLQSSMERKLTFSWRGFFSSIMLKQNKNLYRFLSIKSSSSPLSSSTFSSSSSSSYTPSSMFNNHLIIILAFYIIFFSFLNSQVLTADSSNNGTNRGTSSKSNKLLMNNSNNNNNIINNNNGRSNSTAQQHHSQHLYSSSSFIGFLFDPHVQAQCERNLMHITVSFDQPFYGIVHVRNFRRNPCQTYGNGSLITTLTIDLLTHSNRPNFCGIHRVKGTEERSISLVVRLHRALELSDDKHFVITCGNMEFNNRNKNEKLMFKFVDQHGHKITKLYHGESYRLRAEIIQSSHENSNYPSNSISSYHLYVRNCFIFNGNDSDVEFLDSDGCPTLTTLTPFKQIGQNIAESEINSMFKLPGTNQLHLQCLVELIHNCNFCDPSLCPLSLSNNKMINNHNDDDNNSNNNEATTEMTATLTTTTRRSKDLKSTEMMQMLASTTVYVFEPDQQMSSSILYAGGIGGSGSFSFIGNSIGCTEWRFPWLIALCIMLGILLIIMMVVNIFLCTSMSCSCFKSQIVEHEPTIIEDYDPYKIDIGYYSPYDSRLSLNRSSTMAAITTANSHHERNHYYPCQQQLQSHHNNKPISMSSSYSPSTENTNHRAGAKLINNNNNNKKKNKSKQQTARQQKLSKSSMVSNTTTYNPYQHSPQSIRSEEFY